MCNSKQKKSVIDFRVESVCFINTDYFLLTLTSEEPFSTVQAGQFAQLQVQGNDHVYLRRPISILKHENNSIQLLIKVVGEGTKELSNRKTGDIINVILPLGNSFSLSKSGNKPLLIGGGVGTAPMIALGRELSKIGIRPTFLIGGRSKGDLLLTEELELLGDVYYSTDNGSFGEKGFVIDHSILQKTKEFTSVYTCGPLPMMKAIAKIAHDQAIYCEASLENTMACGIGACLCCVENTKEGHLCVCTDGPIFDIERLLWN